MSKDGLPKWAEVQKRTFTNWANAHLAERGIKIDDLATELSDGLKLIALLETISAKKLPKHNREIKRQPHKTENVSIALQFIKDQGIKMVGIGADDIVDCRAKMVLGLMWTIIQKYQIQKGKSGGGSAKDELLGWVNKAIPSFNVRNFKGDWRDGKALSAIVAYLKPGSIDISALEDAPLENAARATEIAAKELRIPPLVSPEDLISDDADDLSIMTYISYFRDYDQARAGAPSSEASSSSSSSSASPSPLPSPSISVKTPVISTTISTPNLGISVDIPSSPLVSSSSSSSLPILGLSDDEILAPSKCDVYGPGLEGADIGKRNICIIQAVDKTGEDIKTGGYSFDIKITGPEGEDVKSSPLKDNKDGTYTVVYSPLVPGTHKIELSYKGIPLPGSPFTVTAKGVARTSVGSPLVSSPQVGRANVASPSVVSGEVDIAGIAKDAEVDLSGLGSGSGDDGGLSFVVGTKGKELPGDLKYTVGVISLPEYEDVDSKVIDNSDGTVKVVFKPPRSGLYRIEVHVWSAKLDKKVKVKNSPFKINITLEESSSAPVAEKRTLLDEYAQETTVDLAQLGNGPDEDGNISFLVKAKDGKSLPIGWYYDPLVILRAEDLEITPKVTDNKDGTYKVSFKISKPGGYAIDLAVVEADENGAKKKSQPVNGSPFRLTLQVAQAEASHAHKEHEHKEKHHKDHDHDHHDHDHEGDHHHKHHHDHDHDHDHDHEKHHKKHEEEGVALAVATKEVEAEIDKLLFDIAQKSKPDLSNLGGEPSDTGEIGFTIGQKGTKLVEDAHYVATATFTADKSEVPVRIVDNKDGTFQLLFVPSKTGEYRFAIHLSHKGKTIPVSGTPFNISINGPESSVLDEASQGYSINPAGLSKLNEDGEVSFRVQNDAGKPLPDGIDFVTKITYGPENTEFSKRIVKQADGGFEVFFAPRKPGEYTIVVDLTDKEGKTSSVNGTPITLTLTINAIENAARQVQVDLTGLSAEPTKEGLVSFLVGKRGKKLPEKSHYLAKISFEGNEVPAQLYEKEVGLYEIKFRPTKSGKYIISIFVVDEDGTSVQATGSPWEVHVTFKPRIDVDVELAAQSITVDTSSLPREPSHGGDYLLIIGGRIKLPEGSKYVSNVTYKNDNKEVKSSVSQNSDGSYSVSFVPVASGEYLVAIVLTDKNGLSVPIKGSPFVVNVTVKPVIDPAVELAAENSLLDTSDLGTPSASGEYSLVLDPPRRRFPSGARYVSKILLVADKSELPSSVEHDESENIYKVQFKPSVSGDYLVEVNLVDKNGIPTPIKGSPFVITVNLKATIDPAAESAARTTLVDTELGRPSSKGEQNLVFDGPRKGLPTGARYVSKVVFGGDNSEVSSVVESQGDGSFKVLFTPTESGEYSIEIFVVDKNDLSVPVKGSPFKFNISRKKEINPAVVTAAQNTLVDAEGVRESNSNGEVNLDIDPPRKGIPDDSHYVVKVLSVADNADVDSYVHVERDGSYKVIFKAPASGEYSVDLQLVDKNDLSAAVKGSPFKVRVRVKPVIDPSVENAAAHTEVDLSSLKEPAADGEYTLVVDAPRKLPYRSRYVAKVLSPDKTEIRSTVVPDSVNSYKVQFKPLTSGEYPVEILLEDQNGLTVPIKGSPFNVPIQLKPVADPQAEIAAQNTSVDISDLQKPTNASKGEYGLVIGAPRRLPYGSRYSSKVYSLPGKKEIESSISGDSDGYENVVFRPPESGEYHFEIFLVDKNGIAIPINGSPFTANVQLGPVIDPALEIAAENTDVDTSDLLEPGSGVFGFVLAGPRRGLPAGASYTAKVTQLPDNTEIKASIFPDSDAEGSYNVVFTPLSSGDHSIEVKLLDKSGASVNVKGSPFKVKLQVKPAIDPTVEVAAQNTLVDTSDLGEPNANGEFGLVVGAPGRKLPQGSYYIAKVALVTEEADVDIKSSLVTDSDGSYKVVFKPTASGEYSIDILLVDKNEVSIPIKGSPFSINIDLDAIRIARAEKVLTAVAKATKLRLHALGREFSEEGEVSFEIAPTKLPPGVQYVPKIVFAQEKSGEIPVRIIDEVGSLRVVFQPPRSGEYLTQVLVADQDGVSVPVNDPPHVSTINLPPPPAPHEPEPEPARAVSLEELITGFTPAGAEELSDGGFAFLIGYKEKRLPDGYFVDVRVNAVADGADIEARVSDGGEGVTRVEFSPPVAGEYIVSAGLVDQEGNGAEIVGSPFTINITKPTPEKEAKAFAGDTFVDFTGFDRPRYDGTTSFLIGTRGKNVPPTRFRYEPKIICVGNGKAVVGAKALDQKNGTFKVSFAPPLSGDYFVEVDLVDKDDKRYTVKGSPFTVNVNLARSPAPSPLFFNPNLNKAPASTQRPKFGQPPSPTPKPTTVVGTGKVWRPPQPTTNVPKPVVPPWVHKTGKTWKPQAPSPTSAPVPAPVTTTPKYSFPFVAKPPAGTGSGAVVLAKTGGGKRFAVANVPTTYSVSAADIGLSEGESFDVALEGSSGILPVEITYKGDSIFEVSYTPISSGVHKIQFIRGGQLVLEDSIDVDEGADEGESIAVAFTFSLEARLKSGKPKTRGGDKFQVKISGPRGPVNTVQVADQNNGKYNVSYTLPGHGEYEIAVTLNGRQLAGSPWKQKI